MHPVQPLEQRHRQDDLRLLAIILLHLATDQQVEFLVGAAEFHVCLERDRIVALHDRVEELVDRYRLPARVPLAEVVALQHAGDRVMRRELDEAGCVHGSHPARVEVDARRLFVEDLEDLGFVGFGIGLDFFRRQRRTGRVLAGRVADHAREVTYQEHDLVAEFLELAHLVDEHRVADVQVGRRRVEAGLDDERPALFELCLETVLGKNLVAAANQFLQLLLFVLHISLAAGCDAEL